MALFTLANLKTYLGITGTSEDHKLTPMVAMVNLLINSYLNRTLEATTYTDELYDGTGTASLQLKNYPIISVSEVLVNNDELDAVDYDDRTQDGVEGYWIQDDEWGILYNSDCWDRGRGVISVTYRAGYETIPDDIVYGCYALSAYLRNVQDRPGVLSENLGAYGYSLASPYDGESLIIRAGVRDIFDRYKRIDIWSSF